MAKNYRQGEVLIFGMGKESDLYQRSRVKGWQKKLKPVPDNVIIEGEISGHKHEVENGRLYDHPEKKGVMILEAGEGCIVKHPEHKAIPVPKSVYEIEIQREYSEGQAGKVKD
jgi:hypothetical protein